MELGIESIHSCETLAALVTSERPLVCVSTLFVSLLVYGGDWTILRLRKCLARWSALPYVLLQILHANGFWLSLSAAVEFAITCIPYPWGVIQRSAAVSNTKVWRRWTTSLTFKCGFSRFFLDDLRSSPFPSSFGGVRQSQPPLFRSLSTRAWHRSSTNRTFWLHIRIEYRHIQSLQHGRRLSKYRRDTTSASQLPASKLCRRKLSTERLL